MCVSVFQILVVPRWSNGWWNSRRARRWWSRSSTSHSTNKGEKKNNVLEGLNCATANFPRSNTQCRCFPTSIQFSSQSLVDSITLTPSYQELEVRQMMGNNPERPSLANHRARSQHPRCWEDTGDRHTMNEWILIGSLILWCIFDLQLVVRLHNQYQCCIIIYLFIYLSKFQAQTTSCNNNTNGTEVCEFIHTYLLSAFQLKFNYCVCVCAPQHTPQLLLLLFAKIHESAKHHIQFAQLLLWLRDVYYIYIYKYIYTNTHTYIEKQRTPRREYTINKMEEKREKGMGGWRWWSGYVGRALLRRHVCVEPLGHICLSCSPTDHASSRLLQLPGRQGEREVKMQLPINHKNIIHNRPFIQWCGSKEKRGLGCVCVCVCVCVA